MTITRRRLLATLAAAPLAGAALTACGNSSGSGAANGTKVVFGYIPDFNGASLLAVADDQKIWEKHDLNVETKSFTNGPLQIQALGTGDLQFGYIGPGAMWLPASGKCKVVALNGIGRADRVIAQEGISAVADLRGKRVAVPEGTSGEMVLSLALQKNGMTIADVEKVPMDAATVVSAFASKQVDAAGIWYPLIDTIKAQVPAMNELAENGDFADVMAFPNVFVGANEFVTGQQDTALRVLKALREAMDFRAANMDQTIALTAKMNKLDEAKVRADAGNGDYFPAAKYDEQTNDGTITKWLDAMSQFYVGTGKLQGPEPASQFYTGDLWVKAGQ